MVTTEQIARQTPDGLWYDRNTYRLPLYTQHTLRPVMMVVPEVDSNVVHTPRIMADVERYTIPTEADLQGAIRSRCYLLQPQAT